MNVVDNTLELKNQPNKIIGTIDVNSGLVRSKKTVTIPKHSETIIAVSVSRQPKNSTVLLEPLNSSSAALKNLIVAKCLVTVKNGNAVLRVLNPTNTDVKLSAHKEIAKVTSMLNDEIYSFDGDLNQHGRVSAIDVTSFANNSQSDKNIQFDLSDADLTSDEKRKLSKFLKANRSIFATEVSELGCTDQYEHHIETIPGARPVSQAPYKQTP